LKRYFINGGERVNPNINLVKNEVKLLASFIYRIETAMASLCQEEITTHTLHWEILRGFIPSNKRG